MRRLISTVLFGIMISLRKVEINKKIDTRMLFILIAGLFVHTRENIHSKDINAVEADTFLWRLIMGGDL